MRFLIIDDVPNMRRAIRNMLRAIDYKDAEEADDGDTALKILKSSQIDFIICDWYLPRMSGIDLLRAIREEPAMRDIPFLMVTGDSADAQVALAAEEDVDGYVIKPFVVKTLESKIKNILNKRANPGPVETHLKLGLVYKENGMLQKALAEFQKAKQLNPNSARIAYSLGEIHEMMGNDDSAENLYKEASTNNPLFIKAHHNLSQLYIKKGNEAKAIDELKKAAEISPNNSKRQVALGKLHLKTGNRDEAEKAFSAAAKSDPKNYQLQAEIGETYLESGMDDRAVNAFRGSLELHHDANIYNRLGIALRRQKRYKEAIEEYQKALKVEPGNEALYYNMGRALLDAGRIYEAREAFEKALQIDPSFEECRGILSKMDMGVDMSSEDTYTARRG